MTDDAIPPYAFPMRRPDPAVPATVCVMDAANFVRETAPGIEGASVRGLTRFMDLTDFSCELGDAAGGNVAYATPELCVAGNPCAAHCGVVEVRVSLLRVLRPETVPADHDAALDAPGQPFTLYPSRGDAEHNVPGHQGLIEVEVLCTRVVREPVDDVMEDAPQSDGTSHPIWRESDEDPVVLCYMDLGILMRECAAVPDDEGVLVRFMDKVDFEVELGGAMSGNVAYPTAEACVADNPCIKRCGMVEISVVMRAVASDPLISGDPFVGENATGQPFVLYPSVVDASQHVPVENGIAEVAVGFRKTLIESNFFGDEDEGEDD